MAITKIGVGPRVTNFGPPPSSLDRTKIGTSYLVNDAPTEIGGLVQYRFSTSIQVPINQAAVVFDRIKMDKKVRVVSAAFGNKACVATAQFDLYNITDAALIIPLTALTTATTGKTTTFSSATQQILENGDEIGLRFTTNASGTVDGFDLELTCQVIDTPDGAVI